jgi:hypothetical protein
VTRWPTRKLPEPIEPPEWVRVFHPEAWAEPDEHERRMAGDRGLPEEYRRWHAERRWHAAKRAWCSEHPEYDWLAELQQRRERRRAARG